MAVATAMTTRKINAEAGLVAPAAGTPAAVPVLGKLVKPEIRRGLNISIWEGASAQVHAVLTTGGLLTGFALAWGANDFQLGLLGAIPFLGQMGQIVGAYLVERQATQRRLIVALLGFAARSCWFVIAGLPFLIQNHPSLVVPAILLIFTFYQMAYCASSPGWVAWMAVLVPRRLRGRYLGRRMLVVEVFDVTTALASGWAIDAFRTGGHERFGFAILQLIAGLAVNGG